MKSSDRYKILLDHLDWNIQHLKDILKNPKTVYYRDASIQRFGFTFDSAFKCLKTFLEIEKKKCSDIDNCFNTAEEFGWFSDDGDWKLAVKDYRSIVNGFLDDQGDSVYNNLQNHLIFFEYLHDYLSEFLSRHGFL